MSQTGAQAVTIDVTDQSGLAVNQLNGPFRTGCDAQTTAITFVFINLDYISNRHRNVSDI